MAAEVNSSARYADSAAYSPGGEISGHQSASSW